MAPNGLIFLVVVAIWGAYFVQYWIRRREHLSTARSMDRFSESMRVLARRSPLPESSLETPAPTSYAVHPAKRARPQVIVKRATVTSLAMQAPVSSPVAARSKKRAATASMVAKRFPRAFRGVLVLAQLLALPVLVVMAALAAVSWWAPLLAVAGLGCALVWLRVAARAEAAARAARRRAAMRSVTPAGHPSHPGRGTLRAAGPRRPAPAAPVEDDLAAHEAAVDGGAMARIGEPAPYDIAAPRPVVAQTDASPKASHDNPSELTGPLVDDDDIPLTWDPRPVPRPTYAMKARVEHPLAPPAEVTPHPSRTETAGADTAYDEQALARSAAGA